ncbi:MAG: sulfotransferase [Deltaproteobacteria bacterium]|jgi:hypothetical protein|nr:sulfotransferase [Deltaproteobacteria bacterium]
MSEYLKKRFIPKYRPVFIVGYRRSGTTLLRNVLHSHPEIAVVSESHFIAHFYDTIELYGDLNDDKNLVRLATDIISTRRYKGRNVDTVIDDAFVRRVYPKNLRSVLQVLYEEYSAKFGKTRWGDKTPYFLYRIPMLLDLFPNCRIIHVVRDPRAAIWSQIKAFSEYDVYQNATKWVEGMLKFDDAKSEMAEDQFLEVKYEDLVRNPANTLASICNFALLEYDDQILHYYDFIEDDIGHAKSSLHLKPISIRHIDTWKSSLSKKDILRIESSAGRFMRIYGYELINDDNEELAESILKKALYKTISYCKTKCNLYNFVRGVLSLFFRFLSKIGVVLISFDRTQSIGAYILRKRIRCAVFDKPREKKTQIKQQ